MAQRASLRRTLLVATAVGLVVVAVVVLLRSRTEPFVFRWPEGTVYTYRLTLEVNGSVAAAASGPDAMSAALALDGELELRSYGKQGDSGDTLLGARLTRLRRVDWTFAKQSLLPEGSGALVGTELAVVAAPDGTFRRLKTPADAPVLVNLFRQLLAPLEVIVAPGEQRWTRQQTNQVGDVRVKYETRASRPDVLALRRRPVRYTRLAATSVVGDGGATPSGAFDILLDRAGHLDRIAGEEVVSVARPAGAFSQKTRIEARLLSVTRGASKNRPALGRFTGLVSSGLGDVSASPDAEHQAREKRIAGLTMSKLIADLLIHGSADEFPDAGRWMWRATGLLLQHPERCRELVELFKSPKMTDRSRGRVLDLLAGTGSPQAQTVLRELLETAEARDSARYPLLLQRLSLVQAPTSETVAYLRAKVEQGDSANTLAAAHALGSAVGSRARRGADPDPRAIALLRQGLESSRSAAEKTGWLGALGNAGLAQQTPLIVRYATDSDASVRASAAGALRKIQTPASEKVLMELTGDPDPSVQDSALRTLARYELSPVHFDALSEQVSGGKLTRGSYAPLMALLERNRKQSRAVLKVVEAMLAQPISNKRLLLRIRALKARLSR